MGRQHKTAGQAVEKKADYLFSLKKNPGLPSAETLYDDVQEYFKDLNFFLRVDKNRDIPFQSASTHDERHGRIEDRDYAVSGDVGRLVERHSYWTTIRRIGAAESSREVKGEITVERRHFISSLPADAQQFAKAVRIHWGIENSLHYVLDASFGEDGSRLRKDKGPENTEVLGKVALTAARADTETKSSIIGRRKL
jgi:predicted transposase YbfD/YdcC